MKSGKKFFFWLGVLDAQYRHGQNKAARRENYIGQTKPVWVKWQKVAYLTGYWQTQIRNS